ncbi:MAG: hydroxymethylbilane synthase [Chloroflexi bacterium]|nr:hydroxymethylbilane synthase [Chloroflexota bacterium]
MTSLRTITLGTRGSALARCQTELVLGELQRLHPGRSFSLKVIATLGDRASEVPFERLEGEGVFVKELEAALLNKEVDLAVHSLKDLPTGSTPGLALAAFPQRGEVRDVLVCPRGHTLDNLPKGSRLGTSSPRRAIQLRACRPDLEVLPIRGNVDTRLRKVEEGQFDAIVLAAAGLERLGRRERITQYLPPEVCLPAVGQGALAVQARAGDAEVVALAASIDHPPTRLAVTAERAFLEALGGGCRIPIAALGQVKGDVPSTGSGLRLELEGLVAQEDGSRMLRARLTGEASRPEKLGRALADEMLAQGAAKLLRTKP